MPGPASHLFIASKIAESYDDISDAEIKNLISGENENYRMANKIDNLITLCPSCHRRAEAGQQTRSALGGLAYVLRNLSPLFLMCDPGDIQVGAEAMNPLTKAPTVVVYERVAAGVGFSQRLFEMHDQLLE